MLRRLQNASFLLLVVLPWGVVATNEQVSSFAANIPTESPSNPRPPPSTASPTAPPHATKVPAGPMTTSPTTSRPPHITASPVITSAPVAPIAPVAPVEAPVPVAPVVVPVPVATPIAPPVPVATPVLVPVATPVAPPVAPSPVPPPIAAPTTAAPTASHVSLLQILAKTVAWLILILLSVVAFGAAMSHRYRIYYFLRTTYYRGRSGLRWLRAQLPTALGGGGGNASFRDNDVNTILFDNDMNEGLLMRESDYD